VGASIAGERARGATSHFGGVMVHMGIAQTGCGGVTELSGGWVGGLGLAKGDGGLVGRKSLMLGTGPIDLSVSGRPIEPPWFVWGHTVCGDTNGTALHAYFALLVNCTFRTASDSICDIGRCTQTLWIALRAYAKLPQPFPIIFDFL
jgi:hypothetical protein